VITLDSSAETGGLCNEQYTLPAFATPTGIENYKFVTLTGDPNNGTADGFDGTGLPGRVLTGNNIHRMEIQSLVFRDSSVTGNGGAIAITGESSVGLRDSQFFNNSATGKGGAVYISQAAPAPGITLGGIGISGDTFGSEANAAEGNTADGSGGAVAIDSVGQGNNNSGINGSLFANNVAGGNGGAYDYVLPQGGVENMSFSGNTARFNKAGGAGGGAGHVVVQDATILRFDQEMYEGNTVEPVAGSVPATPPDHFGGGLYVEDNGSQIVQRGNTFTGNAVKAFPGGQNYGGGGEAIVGNNINQALSQNDTFTNNTVVGQPGASAFESEGGGLYFEGSNSTFHGWLDVIAANQVGANGEGGGAYAGAVASAALEFSDSTIAGNAVGANGLFAGLAGGGDDRLQLHNSIVFNGAMDIGGFSEVSDIQYSDACLSPGVAFPGTANMCTDPLLRDPAAGDIHQTLASPTVDKGNDELFFEEDESPVADFEGDPRPTDGDGDGHTVDIGADEGPAFVAPVIPPVVPATPQCGDGKDNDVDGAVDLKDPGCANNADNNEGDESLSDLALCGGRKISLVRADARGGQVLLSGFVAASLADRSVTIFANYGKKKLGTVKPNAAGQFTARVKGPPRKLFNKARFQARVGSARSVKLKLPQSLASSSVKSEGGQITLRGKVKRSVLGKRNLVVVRRIVCGQYQTVGSAKPSRRGVYVVRFPTPALTTAALYRAETRVLARPGSKRYVKQFARAIGITLTGQTG